MKLVNILFVLSISLSSYSDDVLFLICKYPVGTVADSEERVITIEVDLKGRLLLFEDDWGSGVGKYEYDITEITNAKIISSRQKNNSSEYVVINRVNGNWKKISPFKKSDNHLLWNEEEKKLGVSSDKQMFGTSTGTCMAKERLI